MHAVLSLVHAALLPVQHLAPDLQVVRPHGGAQAVNITKDAIQNTTSLDLLIDAELDHMQCLYVC